jgi:hypothetical protein
MAVVASYEATEPRDKIFAVRGLLKKLDITLPLPDYAASLTNVYWQATKVFLLKYPEILYLVTGFPSPHLEDAHLGYRTIAMRASVLPLLPGTFAITVVPTVLPKPADRE